MKVQQLVSKDHLAALVKTVGRHILEPLQNILDENFTIEELTTVAEGFVKDKNWVMALPVVMLLTECQFVIQTQQVAQRN